MADINLGVGGANSATGGYDIDNSLKFEADNTEYLSRNPSTDTNRQTFTYSTWVKRTELGQNARLIDVYNGGANFTTFGFDTSDRLVVYSIDGGLDNGYHYTPRFRDTSAWYHMVWKSDITNATAANRWQIYVNGVEITAKDIDYGTPLTNFFTLMNTTISTKIGYNGDQSTGSSQYIAETHLIDGQALEPTEFGEFDEDSGIWKPKAYEGTYGTNGFYLKFDDSASLGADSSGNGNNFTLNNITSADQATDTPTNNFCTLNQAAFTLTDATISQGATSFFNTLSDTRTAVATMAVTKGKWYFEYKFISSGGSTYWSAIGFTNAESTSSNLSAGSDSDSSVLLLPNGTPYENGTIGSSNFSYFGANDIAGIALDVDNGNMYLYKNGTIQNSGNPIFTSIGDFIMPLGTTYANGCGGYFNFGGFTSYTPASPASDENGYGTFEYAPPSGYYAICTKNLAEYG